MSKDCVLSSLPLKSSLYCTTESWAWSRGSGKSSNSNLGQKQWRKCFSPVVIGLCTKRMLWICTERSAFLLDLGCPSGPSGKESSCQGKTHKRRGFDPRWGRSPWVGNGTPLQCSCWKIPWATVHGPAKSQMQLSNRVHAWLYAKGKFFKIKCEAILKSLTFSASYWGHLWFGWPLWLRHGFLERESISRPISLRCPSSLRKKHDNLAGYWQG